jgi:hypothetical protein
VRSSSTTNEDSEVALRDGSDVGKQPITLGKKKANPFTVKMMTRAWNTLYPNHQKLTLPVSHRYVRFKPANLEQLKLLEVGDIPLKTYPFDYEFDVEGDYYDDPAIPNDQIPWLYSVVKADYQFPAIQYEILEDLVLAPMASKLTRRAFKITNNETEGGVTYRLGCDPECNNWPRCEDDPEIGCGGTSGGGSIGGGGNPYPPSDTPPICDPDNPLFVDWEHCEILPESPIGPNACGCPRRRARFPTGCIKVVDTQLPANSTMPGGTNPVHLAGVQNVQVQWWNGWFGFWNTETDANGCWLIDHEDYGRGRLTITFKNSRGVIRGINNYVTFWEYFLAVRDDVGWIDGPNFSNISVIYTPTGANNSNSRMFWYAATMNNALAEFYGFAGADLISTPPGQLQMLLSHEVGAASAPMFTRTGAGPVAAAGVPQLVSFAYSIPIVQVMALPISVLGQLSQLILVGLPDLVYAHGGEAMISDQVKFNMYHEFAHAAHFNGLSILSPAIAILYWTQNALFIMGNSTAGVVLNNNPPYGVRSNTLNTQRCALIEMWGNHIGRDYADRQYGINHSLSLAGLNFDERNSARRVFVLERFTPDIAGNVDLESWIPWGLPRDLIDVNATNPPLVTDPLAAVDVISGFNNLRIFSALTVGAPETLSAFESNINAAAPPVGTSSPATIRTLFAAYGW